MESPAGVGAMVVNGAEPPLASDQAGGDPIDVDVGRCLLEQVRQRHILHQGGPIITGRPRSVAHPRRTQPRIAHL